MDATDIFYQIATNLPFHSALWTKFNVFVVQYKSLLLFTYFHLESESIYVAINL